MDIKKTFEGGEPNISNPDLMLMQYSNRDGITSLCQNLDSKNFGVNLTNVEINATYSHLDSLCTCSLSDGFIIVKGEVAQVADDTEITFTANPGTSGITFRIFAYIEDTANPLGTKTFNNGTIRETWIERRIKIGAQTVAGIAPIPEYAIELGRIKFTQNTNNIDITYTAPRSLGEVAAQYNSPTLTELNENRSTTFNRVLTPNSLWSVFGNLNKDNVLSFGEVTHNQGIIKMVSNNPNSATNSRLFNFTVPGDIGSYSNIFLLSHGGVTQVVGSEKTYRNHHLDQVRIDTSTNQVWLSYLGHDVSSCEIVLLLEK